MTTLFVFLYPLPNEKSAVKSNVVGSPRRQNERLLDWQTQKGFLRFVATAEGCFSLQICHLTLMECLSNTMMRYLARVPPPSTRAHDWECLQITPSYLTTSLVCLCLCVCVLCLFSPILTLFHPLPCFLSATIDWRNRWKCIQREQTSYVPSVAAREQINVRHSGGDTPPLCDSR